ncbi:MAG TPA: M28 family peptidase [Candidatus Krumholzibacteria bacterium]|nr:M28 family peptidase [Candidatus Krumholzibacteria bacterium]
MLASLRTRVFGWCAATVAMAAAGVVFGAGCNRAETPVFAVDSTITHINRQLAFGPRVAGSAARDSCARYIAHTLERYGARVTVQPFEVKDPYGDRTIRMMNVIGSFGAAGKKRLMLCSHYDSRPWADQEKDSTLWKTPIPGAVDGATSTAILLEIARLAGKRAPDMGVDLVFFDGEDYGKERDIDYYLLGSRHFAANLDGYRPVAAVLLDMVGGVGTTARREGTSDDRSRAFMDYVFGRAKDLDLRYFDSAPGMAMIDDHVPLLQAGIDAIDLFGYDFAPWHTLRDDGAAIDKAKVEEVGILLRDLVYNFKYPK